MNSVPHFSLRFSHCMSDFQFSAVQNQSDVNPLQVPPENQMYSFFSQQMYQYWCRLELHNTCIINNNTQGHP